MKIVSLALMLCMLMSIAAVLPVIASAETESYYTYTVENEKATITDCIGLTSIIIPDGVTIIDDEEFYGCTGLTSIDLPDGLTSIG